MKKFLLAALFLVPGLAFAQTYESGVSFEYSGAYNYIGVEIVAPIEISNLENASAVYIDLIAYDADFKSEGVLTINSEHVIFLFGDDADFANHRVDAPIRIETDPSYWKEGMNTIAVKRHEGDGFDLNDISVIVERNQTIEELQELIASLLAQVAELTALIAALR